MILVEEYDAITRREPERDLSLGVASHTRAPFGPAPRLLAKPPANDSWRRYWHCRDFAEDEAPLSLPLPA
jgi:hypothetical protein